MNEVAEKIEQARALLVSRQDLKATQLLGEALAATDDPELLRQIHELAVERHEHAGGFQKIHWHELMIDAEARLAHPVS